MSSSLSGMSSSYAVNEDVNCKLAEFIVIIWIQFIVTKNDVTGQAELEATLKSIFVEALAKKMRSCLPLVHVSSSKSNYGIDELMLAMAEIMSHRWAKPSVHSVPASDSISTSMASSQSTSKSAVTQAPRSMPSPTTKKTSY